MKKTKLLLVTLVCAVMMMGVGYAWWTDAISLVGTANTGNMNVHFENGCWLPAVGASWYATASVISAEDKKVTCQFDNLYPNSIGFIDVLVKNDGTIPAKLKNATINVTGDADLKPYLKAYAYYYKVDTAGNYVNNTFGWTDFDTLENLGNSLNNSGLKNIILEPGEAIFFGVPDEEKDNAPYDANNDGEKENCFVFYVDGNAPNATQNQSVSFDLGIEWEQYNN